MRDRFPFCRALNNGSFCGVRTQAGQPPRRNQIPTSVNMEPNPSNHRPPRAKAKLKSSRDQLKCREFQDAGRFNMPEPVRVSRGRTCRGASCSQPPTDDSGEHLPSHFRGMD